MPQHLALPLKNTAALVLAIDADGEGYPAGCNVHIFPDGPFRSDDGRPASLTGGELLDWQMNAQVAAALIAALDASGKPILYDYEHNSLYGDSRAAGWIDKLVYVPGQGLFGHSDWTPDAAEEIVGKVYRYSSPLFVFDPKTGAVKTLLSVALTNNPALGELGAVGLRKHPVLSTTEDAEMANEEVLAALTKERDLLNTQVAALTAERDGLKVKLDAIEADQAAAALAAEQAKHAELLQAALTDGRLVPAQKPWAEKQSLAALTEYLDATKPVAVLNQQADGKEGGQGGGHGLSQDELAMCTKMGVSPEEFKKSKG